MSNGSSSPTITVGRILQEARSAKGLTIEAAAAASKVSLSFARLMEEEQFHLLPDPLYIVRFLAEYSASLGLDPKQVETQFRRQVKSVWASAPPQAATFNVSRIHLRPLVAYLLAALAAIPLIFVGLSLLSGRPSELPSNRGAHSPPSQEVATPAPQGAPVDAGQPKGSPRGRRVAGLGFQGAQSDPFRHTLKAEAKGITWLAVSVDGSARREVMMLPGGTAEWSADKRFVVTIGNSDGIVLWLDGMVVPLTGGRGQVVREFTLPGGGEPVMSR